MTHQGRARSEDRVNNRLTDLLERLDSLNTKHLPLTEKETQSTLCSTNLRVVLLMIGMIAPHYCASWDAERRGAGLWEGGRYRTRGF